MIQSPSTKKMSPPHRRSPEVYKGIKPLLSPEALKLIQSKRNDAYQVICGTLLLFFQENKRFPEETDVLLLLQNLESIRDLLNIKMTNTEFLVQKCFKDTNQVLKRFKREILFLFDFRLSTSADKEPFIVHCKTLIFPMAPTADQVLEQAYSYFKDKKLEPYRHQQLNRFLTTAHHQFETEFFATIERSLSLQTKKALKALLPKEEKSLTPEEAPLTLLKADQVDLKIDSILQEIQKYKDLRKINLPKNLGNLGSRKLFVKYYDRV